MRKARPAPPVFVCIPRQVLTRPPIRHRGSPADTSLSVFEFVIGVACIALARPQAAKARHDYALRAGLRAMNERRQKPIINDDRWTPREQFEAAGSDGYAKARSEFNRAPIDSDFKIQCSRSMLLHSAGLSCNQRNLRKLSEAMRQLARPVGNFPPLLLSWRLPTTTCNAMRICVNRWWVPRRQFTRVPWPAPKGPIALAAYLWMFGADTRAKSQTSIRLLNLYRILGIPLSCSAHSERSLNRALDLINSHLGRLNVAGALDNDGLTTRFEIVPSAEGTLVHIRAHNLQNTIDDARARFVFDQDEQPEDGDDDNFGWHQFERKVARLGRL
jgi:hypothetical protein